MYRYKPYKPPGRTTRAEAARRMAMQTAICGGVIGGSMMMVGIFATLPR